MKLSGPQIGIGWRAPLAMDLMTGRALVDFVEVVAETCFTSSGLSREAEAISEIWPVVPHGVKLSLGSAEGIDDDQARRLGALARTLRAPLVTEHCALTRAGGFEIGHLTQLPRTRQAVAVLARNVGRARRFLPDVPFALENVAWSVRWPDDEMPEEDFYASVAEATGCPLLLDLSNLYANALNEGRDPLAVLSAWPLDRVAMVHVAGGHLEHGFYYDDHASAVPGPVLDLLAALTRMRGAIPMLLERDSNFPAFAELADETRRLRAIVNGARSAEPPAAVAGSAELDAGDLSGYAARQGQLARALVEGTSEAPAGFDLEGIRRTRSLLQHKRVDDALPLLTRLARHGAHLLTLAADTVAACPRPPRRAALSDAWNIAHAAALDPALAPDARADLLVLRARFRPPRGVEAPDPRFGPFVGSTETRRGRLWALKGLGASAEVTLIERNR